MLIIDTFVSTMVS